jgi:DNA-binding IclR family transcriptional regulator
MDEHTQDTQIVVPEGVKVKSLYKAVELLFFFSDSSRELSITELSQKSGLLKSSVHNILSTFEFCGLIKHNPDTNRYSLGVRLLELSNQFFRNNDLRHVLSPHMNEIANQVGESVFLGVISNARLIYMDGAFPRASTTSRNMTGITAPLYCTGIGKALLAYHTELLGQIIQEGLTSFTPSTITDPDALLEELSLTRERGYAIDNMEHEYGVKCVAVPVYNCTDQIVAAISVSGPSPRFDEDRIVKLAALLAEHTAAVKNYLLPDYT